MAETEHDRSDLGGDPACWAHLFEDADSPASDESDDKESDGDDGVPTTGS